MRRRAKDLIGTNINILHRVADVLLEKEQIDGDEFLRIMMEEQASQVPPAVLHCLSAGCAKKQQQRFDFWIVT